MFFLFCVFLNSSPSTHLKVIVTQRQVRSKYDTTLMTDSVATETRTSRDTPNATDVFFGSFQWTSCKTVWGRGVRFNLTNRDEEPRKQMEDFTQNDLKTLRQTDSSIVYFNDDWTVKEIDSVVSIKSFVAHLGYTWHSGGVLYGWVVFGFDQKK